MGKRFKDDVILARWVVDAGALHDFLRESRIRSKWYTSVPKDLWKECEKHATGAGLEVVVRENALFVGEWGSPNWFYEVQVHETWMLFMGDEGYHVPVPLVPEAERIAVIYAARYEQARLEAQRQFDEERAIPTWNNRLLLFVEAHFACFLLGFFFVLIPLLVLLLGFLRGDISG